MRRSSICKRTGLRRGTWTPEEDSLLIAYIQRYGHWNWHEIPKYAGLSRCGKSCRLRWMNYLRPNIKRGNYTREEEELIINLHAELGNRWSAIATCLPGRTDNEIKNHWHTTLRKPTKRTSIVKETIPMPNVEHEALGRESAVPNGDHPHDIAPLAVPNGDHPYDITPLILESSPVLPMSPPKSSDFSSSSTYDFDDVFSENRAITDDSEISSDEFIEYDGNFWTEPFLVEDSYNVDDTMPVFENEYSASLLAEALYPYDLCNGYDMDTPFDLI